MTTLNYARRYADALRYSREHEAMLKGMGGINNALPRLVHADWLQEKGFDALSDLVRRSYDPEHRAAVTSLPHDAVVARGALAFRHPEMIQVSLEYAVRQHRDGSPVIEFRPATVNHGTKPRAFPGDKTYHETPVSQTITTADHDLVHRLLAEADAHTHAGRDEDVESVHIPDDGTEIRRQFTGDKNEADARLARSLGSHNGE